MGYLARGLSCYTPPLMHNSITIIAEARMETEGMRRSYIECNNFERRIP